jgi:hypothetical protein
MNGALIPVVKTVVADCGTVVLKNGASAQAAVTAAMTDDRFYDVSKAKVTYTSNNPTVAEVNEKGLVTARGIGIATISASVTIDGKTESDGFPIKVMPDLNLLSITVNNNAIKGFDPKNVQYSYLFDQASSQVPLIGARPVDDKMITEITQAKSVPGSATITIFDPITYDRKEYVVNFGVKSVNDEFNGTAIGGQWNWVRENPTNWKLDKNSGQLKITSGKGDISEANNNAENILLQSANTDWILETKMTCTRKPAQLTENAGIIAYQDDDNFVKLIYRATMGRRGQSRSSPLARLHPIG